MLSWFYKVLSVGVFSSVLMWAGINFANADSLQDVGEKLRMSVVMFEAGSNKCSATKIGESQYLTAKHCVISTRMLNYKVSGQRLTNYVRSILVSTEKKLDSTWEDWAILNVADKDDKTIMPLGCSDELKYGTPVATFGYPNAQEKTPMFFTGIVSGFGQGTKLNESNLIVSFLTAPGASGSSVINLETGNIIGVLTEFIPGSRVGSFGTGVESIKSLDACDDVEEKKKVEDADPF